MKFLVLLMATALSCNISLAREIDDPNSGINARPISEGTTILRVDTRDNSSALLNVSVRLNSSSEAQGVVADDAADFKALPAEKVRGELDRDGAAVSWYFYWNTYNYYYPNYCYYGNYYSPYYSWNYGYYNYYYYGYPGRYWR